MSSAGVIAARESCGTLHRPNALLGLFATCAAGSVGVALGVTPSAHGWRSCARRTPCARPSAAPLIRSFLAAAAIVVSAATAREDRQGQHIFASTWSNICPSTYLSPASRIEKMR